jgi:hypothetical protein
MMDLRVVGECSPAIGVPSPAPSNPTVFDQHGEPIGELLLWLASIFRGGRLWGLITIEGVAVV